jgi:hypothetical protein
MCCFHPTRNQTKRQDKSCGQSAQPLEILSQRITVLLYNNIQCNNVVMYEYSTCITIVGVLAVAGFLIPALRCTIPSSSKTGCPASRASRLALWRHKHQLHLQIRISSFVPATVRFVSPHKQTSTLVAGTGTESSSENAVASARVPWRSPWLHLTPYYQ